MAQATERIRLGLMQRPHPPICIGGKGERRTLRTVARVAQHSNMPRGTVAEFAHLREVLAGHGAAPPFDPS
ncbi:MAG TPA: hypothetical protein VKB57_11255, partial [Acidimicrobiales bacterium]|nr:hypothetical protein [Acidimicrobiales bacterium]